MKQHPLTSYDPVQQNIAKYLTPSEKTSLYAVNQQARKHGKKIPMRKFYLNIQTVSNLDERNETSVIFSFDESKTKLFRAVLEEFVNIVVQAAMYVARDYEDSDISASLAVSDRPSFDPEEMIDNPEPFKFYHYDETLESGAYIFIEQAQPGTDQSNRDYKHFLLVDLPDIFEAFANPEWLDMKIILSKVN